MRKIPPIGASMSVDPASLPNRKTRRVHEKMKGKPHYQKLVQGNLPETETPMPVDEETKAALLQNLDVQRFLAVLNGVLTGTKKLVIESDPQWKAYGENGNTAIAYTHTFRVEDVGD